MRSRSILIMAVVVVVLGGLLLVTREPDKRADELVKPTRDAVFPTFNVADIAMVAIESFGTSVTMIRHGEEWHMDEERKRRADGMAIYQVLEAMAQTPEAKLISTTSDPNQWLLFKVHPTTAKRVRLWDSAGVEQLDVMIGGHPKLNFNATYVRPSDSDSTYQLDVPLRNLFEQQTWRNRMMLSEDPAEFASVTIETTTNTITLERAIDEAQSDLPDSAYTPPPAWRVTEPSEGEANELAAGRLNMTIRYLNANAPEDNRGGLSLAALGLDPPVATVTFRRVEGEPIVLRLGAIKSGTLRTASITGDEQLYLLGETSCEFFFMKPEAFLKQEAEEEVSDAPTDIQVLS